MSILKIARMGHPVLRRKASEVSMEELKDPLFRRFINDMVETMRDYGGVGLAAPQVHISKRIFVVEVPQLKGRGEYEPLPLTVLINPEIVALSNDLQHNYEGCLSIPDLIGYVPRFKAVKVSYTDLDGNRIGKKVVGFPAAVIQHENDHLEGILYIDRMEDLTTLSFTREYEIFGSEAQ